MSNLSAPAEVSPTPYLLIGESMRRELTRHVRECVERWRQEWAGERSPEFRLELHEARVQVAGADWRGAACFHAGMSPARPALIFIVPSRMTPWVAGVRADAPRDGMDGQRSRSEATIAHILEMEALSALASRIFDSAGMQRAALERGTLSAEAVMHELGAARYLRASLRPGECTVPFGVLVSPALASGLLPARRPTTSQERMERRSTAVTAQDVGIEAVLGSAEITVADLARLSVGDVIVMNASLSEPAELKIRAGERIAAVSAGSCSGRRAVQIRNEGRRGKT